MRKPAVYRVLEGSFMKLCLRCTIADWFRKNHKWTRGHSSKQNHRIMQPSSKSIRICESRCYKRDQATVSIYFDCGEPSRNDEDETPSNKFARLLPRFWKGNEWIYSGDNKLVYQTLHPPEILLSHSRACNGSFSYCQLKSNSSSAHGQKTTL